MLTCFVITMKKKIVEDSMCMGFHDSSVVKESTCNAGDPVEFLSWEDPLEKGLGTFFSVLGLPSGSTGKESACDAGDLGSIPGLGRSPGEGKGYPLQSSDPENAMDYIVYGVTKRQTRLSNIIYTPVKYRLCCCNKRQISLNKFSFLFLIQQLMHK